MLDIKNYNYTIEPLKADAGKLLKEVVKKLPSLGWWISAGTALGLYRDGDFIKGDTDLDFAMLGYYGIDGYIKRTFKKGLFGGGYRIIREVWDGDKVMQIAFIKNGMIVDFYFHWDMPTAIRTIENHGESGWTRMDADICLNPNWILTKYGKLPIPKEEYFEIRYGKDWRTPQDKKPIFYEI